MTAFHKILPECIDYLPAQAIEYLDNACKHPPASDMDCQKLLLLAKHGFVDIYLVMKDSKLTGTAALHVSEELDILDLGGDNFMSWKDDFWDFCIGLMRARNIGKCTITGRAGFKRVFPKLKPVGIVYEYSL